MAEIINKIVTLYDQLQRSEAAERAAILQQALDQVNSLTQERSNRLRASMHDLKGGLGIISGTAGLLQLEGIIEPERTRFVDMLTRNLVSVQLMLANLTDLSRLEAGAETLQIQPLDAAQLLQEMTKSVHPIAQQRNLVIRTNGPDSLIVQTDGVKLQRIIQNLLLNALKYTLTGFIDISWAQQDANQWLFRIQDSGPGLPVHLVRRLTEYGQPDGMLNDCMEPDQHQSALSFTGDIDNRVTKVVLDQPAHESNRGEGIGLTIVKEFSQLLGAKLAVEAALGQGTCFRFWLPIRYSV